MGDSEDLIIRFIGYDLLSTIARQVGSAIQGLGDRVDEQGGRMSRAFVSAGEVMMGAGAVMIAAGAIVAAGMFVTAKAAADFESQLVLLHTQARYTADGFNSTTTGIGKFRQQILDMAPGSGFGPTELARALYLVVSVGGNVTDQMGVLRAAAMGAAVGQSDLQQTTSVLATIMALYGGATMDANRAMGILDVTVGVGKMRLQDLISAFATGLLPVAQQSGLSLQSLGGAMATMADAGIPPSRAATYLRSSLIMMTTPTGPAIKALNELGLGADTVTGQMDGFSEVLKRAGINQSQVAAELQKTGSLPAVLHMLQGRMMAAGLTAPQAGALIEKAFGGIRSGTGMVTLYNQLDRLDLKTQQVTTAGNQLVQNFDFMVAHDPSFAIKQLHSTFDTLVVVIGEAFIPVLVAVAGFVLRVITPVLQWIRAHEQLVMQIGTGVATFLLVGGAILLIVGAVTTLIGFMIALAGPIALVAAVIGIIASMALQAHGPMAGFLAHIQALGPPAAAIGRDFMDVFVPAFKAIGRFALTAGDALVKSILPVMTWMAAHGDIVRAVFAGIAIALGVYAAASAIAAVASFAMALGELAVLWPVFLLVAALILLGAGIYLLITHWGQIHAAMIRLGHYIASGFMAAWHAVVAGVTGAWRAVTTTVMGAVTGILTRLTNMRNAIGAWINGIVSTIEAGWAAFAARPGYWLGYLIGYIIGWTITTATTIATWAGNFVSWAATAAVGFATNLATQIGALPGRFAGWFGGVIIQVTRWAGAFAAWAPVAAARFVGGIAQFLIALPGNVASWLWGVLMQVGAFELFLLAAGTSAGVRFANALRNEFNALPGQVHSIGVSIARGLVNGIMSMGSWVKSQASGFVKGIVSGMKAAIGAHSPSTMAAEQVGAPLPMGVAVGITENASLVHHAFINMFDAMPPAPSFGNAGMGIVRSITPQPVVTTPSRGGSHADETLTRIADTLEHMLKTMTRDDAVTHQGTTNMQDLLRQAIYKLTEDSYSLRRSGVKGDYVPH